MTDLTFAALSVCRLAGALAGKSEGTLMTHMPVIWRHTLRNSALLLLIFYSRNDPADLNDLNTVSRRQFGLYENA